ncbi:MAG: serine/threonine-protein kinase [Myxococcota bacterium]|nr:serine/threonine-protein kinase [Myxococcota bacterium]
MNTKTLLANGRYDITGALGEGGMAYVFKAYDTRLKVERAVKILAPRLMMRKKIRDRFEAEAATMAQLHHKNIVTIHDIGNENNLVYMVMEMLTGGSLMDRIEDHGPLHPQLAIDAAIEMAAGLGYAHENNVVHRDVKPHNVLISNRGVLKVADFGIARIDDGTDSMTKTGAVMGTLAYMAPEQRLSARRAGPRSDLYAVAASLYVMITNGNPVELYSEDIQETAFEEIPECLAEFIKIGCHFNPDKRFNDSEDMIEALRELKKKVESLPEDALPIYIPRKEANKEPSPKDITTMQTMWNSLVGETSHGLGTGSFGDSPSSSSSDTIDFDLFGEEAEPIDPLQISENITLPHEEKSQTQSIPPNTAPPQQTSAPNQLQNSIPPQYQHSIPPNTAPPQNSNNFGVLILVVLVAVLGTSLAFIILQKGKDDNKGNITIVKQVVETKTVVEQSTANAASDSNSASPPKTETATQSATKSTTKTKTTSKTKTKSKTKTTSKTKTKSKIKINPTINTQTSVKPAVPAIMETGSVKITSRPRSTVVFKGKNVKKVKNGKTHKEYELPVGRYSVTLTTKGGETHTQTIKINKGKKTTYCWNFKTDGPC